MNLLTQNSKLKRTSKELNVRVFNFGIPAYKSASGRLTCPFAKECIKFCYARKGAYIWSNVSPAFEKRYQITLQHDFVRHMSEEIEIKRPDYIRVHDSGDYYSREYLMKWLEIAAIHPHIRFYSYTNCVDMLKKVDLPENYDIIYSDSGKQKHLINRKIDRHTKIFHDHDEMFAMGYLDASKIDLYATKWFNRHNINVGLISH
tara:strand:+ start:588 stop:1196 length:609 start_codon:yes stop_codon:yes gene_type:complete